MIMLKECSNGVGSPNLGGLKGRCPPLAKRLLAIYLNVFNFFVVDSTFHVVAVVRPEAEHPPPPSIHQNWEF